MNLQEKALEITAKYNRDIYKLFETAPIEEVTTVLAFLKFEEPQVKEIIDKLIFARSVGLSARIAYQLIPHGMMGKK